MYETIIQKNTSIVEKLLETQKDPKFFEKLDKQGRKLMTSAMFGLALGRVENVGKQFRNSFDELLNTSDL